ncbi:MAG: hypothetical protein KIT73_10115 [Burkholderiales bacterium]|nr:hypothetical protein [Burkholderiales bacterium]
MAETARAATGAGGLNALGINRLEGTYQGGPDDTFVYTLDVYVARERWMVEGTIRRLEGDVVALPSCVLPQLPPDTYDIVPYVHNWVRRYIDLQFPPP